MVLQQPLVKRVGRDGLLLPLRAVVAPALGEARFWRGGCGRRDVHREAVVVVAGGKKRHGGEYGWRWPVTCHRCWRRQGAAALGFREGEELLHGSSEDVG